MPVSSFPPWPEPNFSHKEYKGTPPRNGQAAVSRVLSIATKGENVYIELKTGPGKLTNTGAITPNGQPTAEVNVAFKIYEARRMAAAVLAYLQAWDILRMLANQHMVSQPVAYLLVPTTGDVNGNGRKPALAQPVKRVAQPSMANGQTQPVTRKGPYPATTAVSNGPATRPVHGKPAVKTAESASPPPATSPIEETAVNHRPIPPPSSGEGGTYSNGRL